MDSINDRGVAVELQLSQVSQMETSMYGSEPFVKNTPKKHTVFDKESVMESEKTISFGELCVFNIPVDWFDMLSDIFLKVKLPDISQFESKWTNTVGYSIIDYINIVHEDTEIVRYTGEYLYIQFILNTTTSKRAARCEMIQHKQTETALTGFAKTLLIDLPFFKSFSDKQMFPLMLMKKDTLKINVQFKPISKCLFIPRNQYPVVKLVPQKDDSVRLFLVQENERVVRNRDNLKLKCNLCYDGYHLTEDEKMLFQTKSGDILFRSVEYRTAEWKANQYNKVVDLDFNGMVSELLCVVRDRGIETTNRYFSFLKLNDLKLTFKGRLENESLDAMHRFWNRANTCTPLTWIYSIPFCLSSIYTQPTGQRRFDGKSSRSSLAFLKSHTALSTILIFATTYTVMSFENGRVQFRKL